MVDVPMQQSREQNIRAGPALGMTQTGAHPVTCSCQMSPPLTGPMAFKAVLDSEHSQHEPDRHFRSRQWQGGLSENTLCPAGIWQITKHHEKPR